MKKHYRNISALLKSICLSGILLNAPSTFATQIMTAEQAAEISRLYKNSDYGSLRNLLTPLAEAGDTEAQYNLGVFLRDGLGGDKDIAQAKQWFAKAAAQNNPLAQNNLANLLLKEAHPDLDTINRLFRRAAEAGSADGQFNLGLAYSQGRGLPQDKKTAAQWYEKAAEQGHASAIYNLGVLYEHGEGVAQDLSKALYWYGKSAESGNTDAQFNLGAMYSRGQGTEKDMRKAQIWYEKAAGQGNVDAMENLARIYYFELHNTKAAIKWWEKAAGAGRPIAQYNLGALYANGREISKDIDKARQLWEKAAKNGNEDAKKALETLK